jgi:phenylacetate-coenzyme A ligase PaaK-like adenylate-forming protein
MLSFEQLQKLVAHATSSPTSDFYPTLYGRTIKDGPLHIPDVDAWRSLPVVTKDALIAHPIARRSFLPLTQLNHLRASSGTSGKAPLFSPRTHVRAMDYRARFHDFKKPFMSFTVPLMPYWHEQFQKEHGGNPTVIIYDPKQPRASVTLAAEAGIDAASLFIYHVQTAGDEMVRHGINANIKFLEITGETCSRALYDYMRATFPNATIVQSYGASEVEDVHIGMPCKPMDGTEPLSVYHPKDTHYLEIIDPETGAVLEPAPGVEGDLLITAYPGEPAAFPLVRFRIGDTIRVVDAPCKEHGTWSFTVLGRTDMEFVKIPGGVLKADEVARVLRLYESDVSDTFVLRCTEMQTSEGPRLKPVLEVELKKNIDLMELADRLARSIRVAPSFTYHDGTVAGRYLPLTCVPLQPGTSSKKHLRIVRE